MRRSLPDYRISHVKRYVHWHIETEPSAVLLKGGVELLIYTTTSDVERLSSILRFSSKPLRFIFKLVCMRRFVNQIPELRGGLIVCLSWQPVHFIHVVDALAVTHVDLFQEEVHVIEYPLRRHSHSFERLFQVDDLAALAH